MKIKQIIQNKQYQFLACVILAIVFLILMSSCANPNTSVPKNTIIDKEYHIRWYTYIYIDNDGDMIYFDEQTDKYNIGDKLNISNN